MFFEINVIRALVPSTCLVLALFCVLESVTGASRGYAFVEFETEREMRRAYKVLKLILS